MWGWLTTLLGIVPREERDGATLAPGPCWCMTAPQDHALFVAKLHDLLLAGSILFLEGSSSAAVNKILEARAVQPKLRIARGTAWPRQLLFHIAATRENLAELAALFAARHACEICVHFHAYVDSRVILQWHDAFGHDPLHLAADIPEPRVRAFCESCRCSYKLSPPDQ